MTRLIPDWIPQIDHSIVERVKPLVFKILEMMAQHIPEPKIGNVTHNPNTRILIELRDEFFKHLDNPDREKVLRAIFNLVIIHYDFDAPYREWLDWLCAEWEKKDWKPSNHNIPYQWK